VVTAYLNQNEQLRKTLAPTKEDKQRQELGLTTIASRSLKARSKTDKKITIGIYPTETALKEIDNLSKEIQLSRALTVTQLLEDEFS